MTANAVMSMPEGQAASAPRVKRTDHRERMKARLWAAALDRFLHNGIEATRVEDITTAVGVSRRTFFRYFASKEDVLLHWFAHISEFVRIRLAERPAEEGPLLALRNSFKALDESDTGIRQKRVVIGTLIDGSTTLRREMLLRQEGWEAELATVIALRMDREADDPTVKLIVTIAYSIFKAASRQSRLDAGALIGPHVDRGFERLDHILALGWDMRS